MGEVSVVSHWYQLLTGLEQTPRSFYEMVAAAVERRKLPAAKVSRTEFSEGGLFSAKREYLRVRRREFTFDICAAPFGSGFFVSWWLIAEPGMLERLAGIPIVGILFRPFLRPVTYWTLDTAYMFQSAVHGSLLEVIDGCTEARGIRGLSELERKPILRDVLSH